MVVMTVYRCGVRVVLVVGQRCGGWVSQVSPSTCPPSTPCTLFGWASPEGALRAARLGYTRREQLYHTKTLARASAPALAM